MLRLWQILGRARRNHGDDWDFCSLRLVVQMFACSMLRSRLLSVMAQERAGV